MKYLLLLPAILSLVITCCDKDIDLYSGKGYVSYILMGDTIGLADRGINLAEAYMVIGSVSVDSTEDKKDECSERYIQMCDSTFIDIIDKENLLIDKSEVPSDKYDGYFLELNYPVNGSPDISDEISISDDNMNKALQGILFIGSFPIIGDREILVELNEQISLEVPGETLSLHPGTYYNITMHIRIYEWFSRMDFSASIDEIKETITNNIKGTWPYEAVVAEAE